MLLVEVTRGPIVESIHVVRGCAVDLDGAIVGEASPGDADWPMFMRSSAKPFQAAPAVAAGVLDTLGLTDRHLAIACASHNGTSAPVGLVREILTAAGLTDTDLIIGSDGQGAPINHQCSGNHALALAWCVAMGWPTQTYLQRDHPAQLAMQAAVAAAAGTEPHLESDNCGMTTHRFPMRAIATAYARLGIGWAGVPGLDQVAAAMRAHPFVVREQGQADSELMAADPALVAKHGAEGAIGIGSSDGLGAVARVVDGAARAWGTAGVAVAKRWVAPGVSSPTITALEHLPMLDGLGRPIGEMRAAWDRNES